ncbi:MAG: sugar kinase [Akkermansia sp.]|nr:sugar kinase [Akkermansia sp.]
MSKVVTFGEIMLRLSPPGFYRLGQTGQLDATYGGSEANVAVSLANFGIESSFVTRLPRHAVGHAAVQNLQRYAVCTRHCVTGEGRMGIYFLEKGIGERSSVCIYDRNDTAIQQAARDDFDWDAIFQDATWFHFSGITPALGKNLQQICQDACAAAKKAGLLISCDLNYRAKLWSRQEACEALTQLCQYVDICICNEEDAKNVFGIAASGTSVEDAQINKAAYVEVAQELVRRFNFQKVAFSLRTSHSASDNDWAGLLYSKGHCCISKTHHVRIADRVGAGDSFAAGLIYSIIAGKNQQETIDFATAASALKHTIEGDFNLVSVNEVERIAAGSSSGRIQR